MIYSHKQIIIGIVGCGLMLMGGGCANEFVMKGPERLVYAKSGGPEQSKSIGDTAVAVPQTSITTLPMAKPTRDNNVGTSAAKVASPEEKADVTVNFDSLSLPAFIQTMYGSVLKRNLSIDPQVASRTDLVTFRTTRPQTPSQVANLTRLLLKSYGIAVQDFEGLVRLSLDSGSTSYLPQLRRGRALPEVPAQLRPVFHLVELEVVSANNVSQWLRQMYGNKLTVMDDTGRNALLLSGQSDDVASALDVIPILDKPTLKSANARMIKPAYWTAVEFANRLSEILVAQGVSVSINPGAGTAILILPIAPLNSVIVFANSEEMMRYISDWAKELDKPSSSAAGSSFFTYPVKYADAQDLARVLGDLLGAGVSGGAQAATPQTTGSVAGFPSGTSTATTTRSTTSNSGASGARIVVNAATNSLIIQGGKPEDYRQWLALLAEIDKPTKSALIEVMVAEVTLTGNQAFGIEWLISEIRNSGGTISGGTLGGLGTPTAGGLTLNFKDNLGALRGLLNMLASNSNAKILSSPKVVARNGETATIQVGQEVPVITSQQSNANTGGTTGGVLQTVQYRNTGVILKVRPVIHSGSRLDLEVSQEVSSAGETKTGVTSSPTISTRKVDTKLTLLDGSTVMLAGLISSSQNGAETGVPWVKDIPGIGNLFKSQTSSNNRTELIILITPYVINDEYEAEGITDAFRGTLGTWAKDLVTSKPSIRPPPDTSKMSLDQPSTTPTVNKDVPTKTNTNTTNQESLSVITAPSKVEAEPLGVEMSMQKAGTPNDVNVDGNTKSMTTGGPASTAPSEAEKLPESAVLQDIKNLLKKKL